MAKINDSSVLYSRFPASFSANKWLDASFAGNGKVGAAVLGAHSNEAILINHAELKHGGHTGVLQDVSEKFPNYRKLYGDAKLFEAEKLLSGEFEKKNYRPAADAPLPLCVLGLNFISEGNITEYERTLDMKSGEVCVNYKMGSTHITRSLFVGRGTDLIAFNAAKSGAARFNVILSIATADGSVLPQSVTKYENGFIFYAARGANGLDYGLVARVVMSSGSAEHVNPVALSDPKAAKAVTAGGIVIKECEGFSIYAKTFVNSGRDTEFKNLKAELSGIKNPYDKMQAAAEGAHRKLWVGPVLELDSDSRVFDMAGLIAETQDARLDTNLIERLFNFGKYLSICSDSLSSPAGLWCGDIKTVHGHLTFNNTAQLLFDGVARQVNPERLLGLFSYYEKFADDLKKNSARVFGLRGYFLPSVVCPESALLGSVSPKVIHFIASGAIAANLFYGLYRVTGDVKLLKSRIFPFMREIFNFYSDFLKVDQSGFYSTIPSYSPESTPGNTIQGKPLADFAFSVNSTIDFLALENLLDNLIEAADVCGGASDVPMWNDMKSKIPQYSVNDHGILREWTNSAFIDRVENCGVMQGYGLWPLKNFLSSDRVVKYRSAVEKSGQIVQSEITLRKASANAVAARINRAGGVQIAETLAIAAVQLAHAGEPVGARNALAGLVGSCFTESGVCLTNDWRGSGRTRLAEPELNIAGNIGFATAVAECIVQSDSKQLVVLPSAFAELGAGRVTDVPADFAANVSVDWDLRRNRCTVKIMPRVNTVIDVQMPQIFRKIKNKDMNFDSNTQRLSGLKLAAGKTVVLDF